MYQKGQWVAKNNIEAMKYFILANNRNGTNALAADAITALTPIMGQKDLNDANDRAAEWQPPEHPFVKDLSPTRLALQKELEELRRSRLQEALTDMDEAFEDNLNLIQSALNALGMRAGEVDNVDGPYTRSALSLIHI